MVHVTVNFQCEGQRWQHGFDIERNSTIHRLKSVMLNEPDAKEDINAFELQSLGRRVPDFEKIQQDHTFEFVYLGPSSGGERAREDRNNEGEWERQRLQQDSADVRRQELQCQKQQAAQEAEAAAAAAATLAEAKAAAAAKARKATEQSPLSKEAQVEVTIDRSLGLTTVVTVSPGATVRYVKEQLLAQAPAGSASLEGFSLAILAEGEAQANVALPDSTVLTTGHLKLETLDAVAPPAAEEPVQRPTPAPRPKGAEKSGRVYPQVGSKGWLVVGGADKGGILVREGKATSSTQLPERLSTGAIVEEVAVEGERLHFRKLRGQGPDRGWASLSISGKPLMEARLVSAEDLFTLERALSLQEDLMEGFAQAAFQREMAQLRRESNKSSHAVKIPHRNLCLKVQSALLPRYGFPAGDAGVAMMLAAFSQHQHEAIAWNNAQIQPLIQL